MKQKATKKSKVQTREVFPFEPTRIREEIFQTSNGDVLSTFVSFVSFCSDHE